VNNIDGLLQHHFNPPQKPITNISTFLDDDDDDDYYYDNYDDEDDEEDEDDEDDEDDDVPGLLEKAVGDITWLAGGFNKINFLPQDVFNMHTHNPVPEEPVLFGAA
jgi:hypothetical protein